MKKFQIQVRKQLVKTDSETFAQFFARKAGVVETISRQIRSEQIGNFNPLFCTYKGNKRSLIKSDSGDVSDPFRREESYAKSFYIEI